MKHLNVLASALALALAAPAAALAQAAPAQDMPAKDQPAQDAPATDAAAADSETGFTWNAAVTSDYVFRGVSLTNEKPALQGGMDYNWPNGLYVGVWGSNIDDTGGAPNLEVDTYFGWNHDLSDKWNFDAQLVRYNYFGEDSGYGSVAYNELIAKLQFNKMFTGLLGYSNNYGNSGENSWYYGLSGSFEVGNGFTVEPNIGYTTIGDAGGGQFNYYDFGLALSRGFGPVKAKLAYYNAFGLDADALGNIGGSRVVLTFSFGG